MVLVVEDEVGIEVRGWIGERRFLGLQRSVSSKSCSD
jgi:hypothetical protein